RFRKSLQLFQSFDLVTKIESWDEKDFYIAQQFVHKGRVVAEGFIKGRFLQRGRKGSVPNRELFDFMSLEFPEGQISDRSSMQKKMESVLAAKGKEAHK
ncbi:MAG: thioesterase family protein, partial [Rhodothermaceae bacterium]|nr:thioesterase family protein [Rhodothermaceae bacterium]